MTKIVTITLDAPIVRGEDTVPTLQLRKPAAGELRGLSIADIAMMKAEALIELLPRITIPTLSPVEAAGLDPADLFQCGLEIAGFFLPAGMRPETLAPQSTIQ